MQKIKKRQYAGRSEIFCGSRFCHALPMSRYWN